MRILLLDPPYGLEEIGGVKQSFRQVINKIPSLGLAYLAAVAKENNHDVTIVDCTLEFEEKKLLKLAAEFNPQVVGITATTPTFKNAVSIGALLRRELPQAIYICGGAHPTVCPEEVLDSEIFDFVVLGEGEETFLELISYLTEKQEGNPDDICGIAFKRNGESIITSLRPSVNDLNSIPFPDRNLLPPLTAYHPTPASYRRLPVAVIMTSRGCPSQCVFCDQSVFGRKLRKRSPENVMTEVEDVIINHGAKEIRFFDDTFTFDPTHVQGICRGMKKLHPSVPWTCLTRVTAINLDMLKMMHDAGCWQILYGLESGDDRILQNLGKGNTVQQNREAVSWAKKVGLSIRADFLVGSPWETKDSFRKTVEFAKSLPLDFAHFNKFVPYPGTTIHNDLVSQGYIFKFDGGSYINNHSDFVFVPEAFTKDEYAWWLDRAYKEFYLRPGYIMRKVSSVRTFTEFTGHLKGLNAIMSL